MVRRARIGYNIRATGRGDSSRSGCEAGALRKPGTGARH